MSLPFKFKQFSVSQDHCAMKIGTDGVLLGAWVSLENNPQSILDIGAGTGIISLQLAQRTTAETIDAVEIDDDAYEQCSENFEASPWGDRLFCYHASVQEFASEIEEKYDLIISNPPFFSEDYKSDNDARDIARFNDALPFQHLVVCASHLLSEGGIFAVILPKKEERNFIQLASENNLYPQRICEVQGTPNSDIKRVLLEFSSKKTVPKKETLVIEISRHHYTPEYTNLVKDFYLKM
ncbi:methyltransferase [Aureisphaera sp. CAU 1614]|uniref:tRNA1(Val) (adenine(37)-N6)-methyltransferase n=1 Tax=Halomarinibacterium sedimenti TaxID=2857106 RepID=A0A9X1JZ76_9FLAO|nr:methyltransferase [Halomarinibacterium sedimenti]MBW2936976.1 methyltransferase [Halomarinibacterium sedimenti]